jgi:type I site-specific restriction endonuclease
MMRTRVGFTLEIAAILAGCATAAQRQYQGMISNNQSAVQELQACAETIYNSPQNAPLRRHAPFKFADVTLEQLSDNSSATDDEIKLILENHPKMQSCRKQALDRISQSTPTLVPILLATFTKGEDSLIDLIQKKQSWGAHVRRVRDATIAETAELQAEGRRITSELQQSHQAELAQRLAAAQAASDALAQYAQTQQIISNMNRPVMTHCFQGPLGNTLNCTTQ